MTEAVITETSPLICLANQWTGFYMITASIIKELKVSFCITLKKKTFIFVYVMRFAIWYHLHNLKNVKNTHRKMLLLVKL